MSIFNALSNVDYRTRERLGRRTQRFVSLAIIVCIITGVIFSTIETSVAVVTKFWFTLAAIFPKLFGVLSGNFILVVSALAIFMGENGSGTTFRPLAVLFALPFWLFAAFYLNKWFAGTIALYSIAIFNTAFGRRPY